MNVKASIASLLFLCGTMLFTVVGAAEDIPTPQQLIDAAHKASDLSQAGPYILKADVVVHSGDKQNEKTGRLTISRDHDRARVDLEVGDLHETRVFLGDKEYAVLGQSALFASTLFRFDQSWDPARPEKFSHRTLMKYKLNHVRRERIHDVDAWCVDKISERNKDRMCFDAARSVLLLEDLGGKKPDEFLDFVPFGQQVYPQRVQIAGGSMAPVEASHIVVTPAILNDEVFAIPEKSLELEVCTDIKQPKAMYTPEPEFPEKARRERKTAVVLLYIVVTKEGKVVAPQPMYPDAYGFGDSAREEVKKWRFKPATCGDRPVNWEMMIEVVYSL